MTDKEKYILSVFCSVKVLHETADSKAELTESSLDGKKYIKKTYKSDKRTVFNIIANIKNEHMPEIYHVFFGEDTVVIEQYIEGQTLEQMISDGVTFSAAQVKKIADGLTDAIDTLHKNGIVHRDIKPSNIIIRNNGQAVLIDYSIARPYSSKRSSDTELFGTVGYAAPEQFGFSQSDFRTDIYAFGVTVKEVISKDNSSKTMRNAVSRCMEFDPSRRFQNIDELRHYLERDNRIMKASLIAAMSLLIAAVGTVSGIKPNDPSISVSAELQTDKTTTAAQSEVYTQTEETKPPEQSEAYTEIAEETEPQYSEQTEVPYENDILLPSEIVRVPYYEEDILCLRMWEDGAYEAEISLGDVPVSISAEKDGSCCNVTVNGVDFAFEDTYVPYAYSYTDSTKIAELVFYDMNSDGIPDILPVLSDALIVEYRGETNIMKNYSVGWCIYSNSDGGFSAAEGEMYSYTEPFDIYNSSPGCIFADFPSYYRLEDGVLELN